MSNGPSLGEAVLHLVGDDSKLITTTTGAKTRVEGILGRVGTGMAALGVGVAATGAAVSAVGGTVVGMATNAASKADEILVMAAKYSMTTDEIQRMGYAAELVDVPLETMLGSFSRLTMSIGAAKDGTGEQADMFAALGVSVVDEAGNLRLANEVWLDTIDALGQMENPTERDTIALKLFGRSAMELNPLIVAGGDALRKYGDEAEASGAVVAQSSVESAGKLDDAMQRTKGTLSGIVFSLGAQLAPGIEGFVSSAGGYMQQFGKIINDQSMGTGDKIQAASQIVSTIATDISNSLPQMTTNGLNILMAIIQGLVSAIPSLMPAIVQIIVSIVTFLIQALPMLMDGAMQIILALATGLSAALPTLIPSVVQMIITIVTALIQNLPMLLQAALQLVIGLAQGLIAAVPILIQQAPTLIQALITGIISMLPMISQAAINIITSLVTGLISAIPQLIAAIPQIISAIVRGIVGGVTAISSAGSQLMGGFWQGISGWFGKIEQKVVEFVSRMIAKIKGVLKEHSPSGVGIDIGENFGRSLPMGLENAMPQALATSAQFGTSLAAELSAGISGAGNSTKNVSFTVNNPVGETTDESMSRGLSKLQFLGVV